VAGRSWVPTVVEHAVNQSARPGCRGREEGRRGDIACL